MVSSKGNLYEEFAGSSIWEATIYVSFSELLKKITLKYFLELRIQ